MNVHGERDCVYVCECKCVCLAVLDGVVREGFSEEVTFKLRLECGKRAEQG